MGGASTMMMGPGAAMELEQKLAALSQATKWIFSASEPQFSLDFHSIFGRFPASEVAFGGVSFIIEAKK